MPGWRQLVPLLFAAFIVVPASGSLFHDVKWTGEGLASTDLGREARAFTEETSRVKRETSERKRLFESSEEYDEEDEKVMGSIFTQFLADSNDQLILDLDFFRHFFNYAEAYRQGMEGGNVDMMRIAVKVVEKLRQFDISPGCVSDMLHLTWTAVEYATHVEDHKNCTDCKCTPYFQQTRNERTWIFDVLDAMGKVPSGILGGNNLWVGSWNTCRKIHVVKNTQGQQWNGQYCLAHLSAYERDNPLKALASSGPVDGHCYKTNISRSAPVADDGQCFDLIPMLNFGVCVPDTCTNYDVTRIITFAIRAAEGALGKDAVCDVTVECRVQSEEKKIPDEPLAMFALYFVIFTLVMMAFGTLYDLFVYQHQIKHMAGTEKQEYDYAQHTFIKVVLAYSVVENGRSLLKTTKSEGEIDCLHGMRVLSMFWIILGHTYYYIGKSLTTDNLIPTLINFPKMFYTQIIVQAPLAVDSFFFLSGLLSAHLFFKRILKQKALDRVWHPFVWAGYMCKRFTRITPVYAVIMLLDVTLFSYISSGPFWTPIEKTGCRISWWTNFLYLNNFLLQDKECCMGWTWFLANDMQLHMFVTPILVIAFTLKKSKPAGQENDEYVNDGYHNAGYIASALLIIASSVIKLWIILVNDFPPAPILTTKLQIVHKLDPYWNDVYIRPYVRCGPFIVGIIVAFLLNHYTRDSKDIKIQLPTKWLIVGWITSTILGLYSVFGLFNYARTGDISEFGRILYVLAGRQAYALAIGWVTFVCATGNGGPVNRFLGWKFFIPLSRITFCAYLLHPIMLQIYNLSRPQPFHFTTFFQMLRHAFEAIFVSYLLAFFFALAFEKPFATFDSMIIPYGKASGPTRKSKKNGNSLRDANNVEQHPLQEIGVPQSKAIVDT